jgi:hypothetical protein
LHALKLMSQAHIVQNNSGRAVVARDGENSRQLGVIDNQGLIEGRKCVVDRDSPKGTLRTQRKVEVTLCARATHYDLLSWLLRGDLVSSQHRGAQLFLFEHRKSTTFTLDVVFVHLSRLSRLALAAVGSYVTVKEQPCHSLTFVEGRGARKSFLYRREKEARALLFRQTLGSEAYPNPFSSWEREQCMSPYPKLL